VLLKWGLRAAEKVILLVVVGDDADDAVQCFFGNGHLDLPFKS
jgi:hypothetical protein